MLVLSRKKGEGIIITHFPSGDVLKLAVVDVAGNKVRLGLDGPQDQFRIMRKEVEQEIAGEENPSPNYEFKYDRKVSNHGKEEREEG